jgi:alkanesulfonate monooxygenase SsuD/methylene tetrahydromethanopterin reductase-like flavin-dependent oxidoreductase (luciferase family)/predicted kinase
VSVPDVLHGAQSVLVVLIGASGSGKSTWAAARYRPAEVVSSDALRAVMGSGPADLDASVDAFALLEQIVAARIGRGLTTVVDTLGTDVARRRAWLAAARRAGLPTVAAVFHVDPAECRRRNRERDRPVPAPVLTAQLRRMRDVPAELAVEGWDLVLDAATSAGAATPADAAPAAAAGTPTVAAPAAKSATAKGRPLGVVLQISRFAWGDDPAGWLRSIADAASEAGFAGLALMDHLIQIPQVGRAWEPIPEPLVTLGLLAGMTSGLELGTLVTPVTYRAPGIIAKSLATLDALSGGRAFCGIGAGWWAREHAGFGLAFPGARERLDQLERAIPVIRALWGSGTKPADGLPETTCYPRPVSDIPIIVGGSGARTLQIARRHADACNVASDLETVDRAVKAMAGRTAVTVLDVPIVGRDREDVAARVEKLRGRTPASGFARRHHAGTPADHLGRYRLLAQRGVRTVFVALPGLAGPDDVLRFAPVASGFAEAGPT